MRTRIIRCGFLRGWNEGVREIRVCVADLDVETGVKDKESMHVEGESEELTKWD